MSLSYNGNDGYGDPEHRPSIAFYIAVAAGILLAAWHYYLMFSGDQQ